MQAFIALVVRLESLVVLELELLKVVVALLLLAIVLLLVLLLVVLLVVLVLELLPVVVLLVVLGFFKRHISKAPKSGPRKRTGSLKVVLK